MALFPARKTAIPRPASIRNGYSPGRIRRSDALRAPEATSAEPAVTVLEIYLLAVEMADRVSARRALANGFFLSVQTAFLATMGTMETSAHRPSLWIFVITACTGLSLSLAWWIQLRSYRRLNEAKFAVINEIESSLPVKVFTREWAILKPATETPASWRGRYAELGLSERMVPALFAALHVLLLLTRIVH